MGVILIVEDDEQLRVLAESVLQDAGHTVVAATGAEGATALLDTDTHLDVLFIDLNLGADLEAGLRVAHHGHDRRPKLSYLYDGRSCQRRHEGPLRATVSVPSKAVHFGTVEQVRCVSTVERKSPTSPHAPGIGCHTALSVNRSTGTAACRGRIRKTPEAGFRVARGSSATRSLVGSHRCGGSETAYANGRQGGLQRSQTETNGPLSVYRRHRVTVALRPRVLAEDVWPTSLQFAHVPVPTPLPPAATTPAAAPMTAAAYQPDDKEQHDGPNGRVDDRANDTRSEVDSELRQQPSSDQRPDYSDDQISDEPEPSSADDLARQPAGDDTDQQDH